MCRPTNTPCHFPTLSLILTTFHIFPSGFHWEYAITQAKECSLNSIISRYLSRAIRLVYVLYSTVYVFITRVFFLNVLNIRVLNLRRILALKRDFILSKMFKSFVWEKHAFQPVFRPHKMCTSNVTRIQFNIVMRNKYALNVAHFWS